MKRKLLTGMLLASMTAIMAVSSAMAGQVLEGDANVDQRNYPATVPFVHPPFYNVCVKVEVDDSGVITSVEDNGTGKTGSVQEGNEELWEQKNKPFFETAVNGGIMEKFVGKTLDEVKAMDMSGADAVSGATMCSAATQEAVINALEGRKGKTFLPGEGDVMPVSEITDSQVVLDNLLPDDFDLQLLDIRYGVYNAEDDIVDPASYTFEAADGKATITFEDMSALKPGKYFVNVVDASGKYRSPHFEAGHGEESTAQAPYFVIDSGLAEDAITFNGTAVELSNGDLADYLKNIEHVIILKDGADAEEAIEQEPVGHHGTANSSYIVLGDDGALNAEGVVTNRDGSETVLFEEGASYTVTIEAYGYPAVSFAFSR